MIFIYCGKIPLEENYEIIHKIDGNRTQEFIVEDRGYYNDKKFGEHYQAQVKRKNKTQTIKNTIDENKSKSATIKKPFPAYNGNSSYIFISYAHKDSKIVFKEIKMFQNEGYNIWYDDELTPGNNWDEGIALALINSSLVVVFISENSVASENVKDEINLALDENINVVPIYLEKIKLPSSLKLRLGRKDAIFKYTLSNEDYLKRCIRAFENKNNTYIKPVIIKIPNCSKKDTEIFLELCNLCLEHSFDIELDPEDIFYACEKYLDDNSNITEEKIASSLKNLEKKEYLINKEGNMGRCFTSKRISKKGFCFYFNNFVDERENKYLKLINAILKDEKYTLDELVEETDLKRGIIEALIRIFRKHDYISCKNDLTILGITIEGENYFEKIIGD